MVRAGEIGGFLDQVLVKVAETFENLSSCRPPAAAGLWNLRPPAGGRG